MAGKKRNGDVGTLTLAVLREIRDELRGTNARLDSLENEVSRLRTDTHAQFESLESVTTTRFESLESATAARFESLEKATVTGFRILKGDLDKHRGQRIESHLDHDRRIRTLERHSRTSSGRRGR